MKPLSYLTISLLAFLLSCTKDKFITASDARLLLSADSLKFDTVFVASGSVYRSLKIINDNNQKLRLSSVTLAGGSSSPFKLNVDGLTGTQFSNIEINARDSIYLFVQVNVDPSSANLPFILQDSISVMYNGNTRKIQLEAWGQNAHFLRNKSVSSDETWNNDLPYVILGYLHVEAGKKLTINPGCRIYAHADAPLIVDGSLQVNGLKDTANRVYFRSDRLDDPYKDYPASWPGIYFSPVSTDNQLTYAVISNAYQALGLESPSVNANPKLILNECIIENAFDAGIIALNSSVRARNCLVVNCGKNVQLAGGGDYQLTHCTVATYASGFIDHKEPVLTVSNTVNNTSMPLSASFRNCIFWGENGNVDDEVMVTKVGSASFSVLFDHNLWKTVNTPANITSVQNIMNQPPLFDSINTSKHYYNFRLKSGSPALDTGTNTGVTTDLDGNPRPSGLPDLGCFEKQ